jgi:hypothetical protein
MKLFSKLQLVSLFNSTYVFSYFFDNYQKIGERPFMSRLLICSFFTWTSGNWLRRILMQSQEQAAAAAWRGVLSCWSWAVAKSAVELPYSQELTWSKAFTTLLCPCRQAKCIGERPSLLGMLTAPCSNKISTQS